MRSIFDEATLSHLLIVGAIAAVALSLRVPALRRMRGVGPAVDAVPWAAAVAVIAVGSGVLWYSLGRKPSLYVTHDNSVLSLDRFIEALNPTFLTVFGRTLQISVIGTVICLLIANRPRSVSNRR